MNKTTPGRLGKKRKMCLNEAKGKLPEARRLKRTRLYRGRKVRGTEDENDDQRGSEGTAISQPILYVTRQRSSRGQREI